MGALVVGGGEAGEGVVPVVGVDRREGVSEIFRAVDPAGQQSSDGEVVERLESGPHGSVEAELRVLEQLIADAEPRLELRTAGTRGRTGEGIDTVEGGLTVGRQKLRREGGLVVAGHLREGLEDGDGQDQQGQGGDPSSPSPPPPLSGRSVPRGPFRWGYLCALKCGFRAAQGRH